MDDTFCQLSWAPAYVCVKLGEFSVNENGNGHRQHDENNNDDSLRNELREHKTIKRKRRNKKQQEKQMSELGI